MKKRKVNRLGNQSYSVVLPMDWIKKNGLEQSTEVFVSEHGKDLQISTNYLDFKDSKTLYAKESDSEESLFSSIVNYYQQGLKEIVVSFKHKIKLLNPILEHLENLWGIDCSLEKDKIILSTVPKDKKPDEIIKKSFFILTHIASLGDLKEIIDANQRLFFLKGYALRLLNTEVSVSTEKLIEIVLKTQSLVKIGECLERIKSKLIKLDLSPFIRRLYDIVFRKTKDETLFIDLQAVIPKSNKLVLEDIHFLIGYCKELLQ